MAVRTLPPAPRTPRAANCADPAKTRIDIRTALHPGRWAATAKTPKETPKTKTANVWQARFVWLMLTTDTVMADGAGKVKSVDVKTK